MKKILFLLLCFPIIGFGQSDCGKKPKYFGSKSGNYKMTTKYKSFKKKLKIWNDCIVNDTNNTNTSEIVYEHLLLKIPDSKGDFSQLPIGLRNLGYSVMSSIDLVNPNKVLTCIIKETKAPDMWSGGNILIELYDFENKLIDKQKCISVGPFMYTYPEQCYAHYGKSTLRKFKNVILSNILLKKKSQNEKIISSQDYEEDIREYLDNNIIENIEGIYTSTGLTGNTYKVAILKKGFKYHASVIETNNSNFEIGDLKMIIEESSVNTIFSIKYFMGDLSEKTSIANFEKKAIISFKVGQTNYSGQLQALDVLFYKIYPKLDDNSSSKKNGEWKGNGSGVIISKSGHIITNHHVIEDADDIEVEFILDDEVQKLNAEIIQLDKTNDLAIIKIVDVNFDGIDSPPYNFKTRSSDVGTKVYAYGYPMALSIMGKEIKVTDGIISSKTGYDGDITTYQISAPIQGGNSGGPLFDDKGNFIGINSSGINKKLADNVGYSIKTSYVLNLIDILPKSIDLPSNKKLANLPLTEQIKEISKYVVLVKVK